MAFSSSRKEEGKCKQLSTDDLEKEVSTLLLNLEIGESLVKEDNDALFSPAVSAPVQLSGETKNNDDSISIQSKIEEELENDNDKNYPSKATPKHLGNQKEMECFQNELSLSENLVSQSNQWFKEIKFSQRDNPDKSRVLNEDDGTFITDFDDDDDILSKGGVGGTEIYFETIILDNKIHKESKELLSCQFINLSERELNLEFNDLPDEVILKIFSYFTKRELCSYIAPVCLAWFHLAKDPLFWTAIYRTDFEAVDNWLLIEVILSWCKQLTYLELDHRSEITKEGFEIIFKSCPKIKHLSLKLCRQVDDQILKLISRYEKEIQSIDLEGCVKLSDSSFAHFIELPIKSFGISYCNYITDEGTIFIVKNFKHLKTINLDGIQWITDDFAKELVAQQNETIEEVFLDGENITDDSMALLSRCSNLRSLELSFCNNLTNESIYSIQKLCKLRALKLRKGAYITSESVRYYLEHMSQKQGHNFRSLNIAECTSIKDECLWQISQKCFNLVNLDLSWCWEVSDDGIAFIIDNCHKLKKLHLVGLHELTGAPLSSIPRQTPDMVYLDLVNCNKIEDEILVHLVGQMSKLIVKNYYGETMTKEPDLYYSSDSDF